MVDRPILSICIPTWNRAKYLKECLDSIVSQKWFNQQDVEIVISDNASTDNTKELVARYKEQYPNIVYHRNDENIWWLKNVLALPAHVHWEYMWLLSDDDMMSDIAIDTTLDVIKQHNPWLILSKMLGFWDWTKIDPQKIERRWEIKDFVGMDNFLNFLSTAHYDITPYIMLLSLFCFKKELYLKHLKSLLKEHGNNYIEVLGKDYFPHSRIIYLPFWNTEKISIIERNLILCRWWNMSRSFRRAVCKDLLRLIQDLDKRYSPNKKTLHRMKMVYYYSVFLYIVMTHIRKYIPKFLYNILVYIGRHVVTWIKAIRSKITR